MTSRQHRARLSDSRPSHSTSRHGARSARGAKQRIRILIADREGVFRFGLHRAAAGITSLTDALAIVISEEMGGVRIFHHGKIFMEIEKGE